MEDLWLNVLMLQIRNTPGHFFVFCSSLFKERNGQPMNFEETMQATDSRSYTEYRLQIPAWHMSLYSPKSGSKIPKDTQLQLPPFMHLISRCPFLLRCCVMLSKGLLRSMLRATCLSIRYSQVKVTLTMFGCEARASFFRFVLV